MGTVGWVVAGLGAFGLGVWLTQRSQRPRPPAAPEAKPALSKRSPSPSTLDAVHPALDRDVRSLLGQGQLIAAIKKVRETTGWSLQDAKTYVEERLP